jgi:hypothetical protein
MVVDLERRREHWWMALQIDALLPAVEDLQSEDKELWLLRVPFDVSGAAAAATCRAPTVAGPRHSVRVTHHALRSSRRRDCKGRS